jgi:hypothetical protein
MSGLKELKYSIIIFFIALFFTSTIFLSLYWFFNIRNFPPQLGFGTWVFTLAAILIPTYFIEIKIIKKLNLSNKRRDIIIYSSLICVVMINFSLMDLMRNYNNQSTIINTIDNLDQVKTSKLTVKNFEIINQPFIYKNIKVTKSSRYLQVYFLYPFKSQQNNIYYSLKFEKIPETRFFTEEEQMENLLMETKAKMQNYDFQKINNFQYLTVMDPDYDLYGKTVSDYSAKFLQPLLTKSDDDKSFNIKFIIGIFFFYIAIFLLSRVEEWK